MKGFEKAYETQRRKILLERVQIIFGKRGKWLKAVFTPFPTIFSDVLFLSFTEISNRAAKAVGQDWNASTCSTISLPWFLHVCGTSLLKTL